MVFTLASNTSDLYEMGEYIPGLGEKGASSIKKWGFDGTNAAELKVSTVDQILSLAGGGDSESG